MAFLKYFFLNLLQFSLGLLIGAIVAFLWMLVLRYIIKPMIWLTILVLFVLLGFGTYFCTQEYISLKNLNQSPQSFKFSFDLKYLSSLKETWLTLAIIQGAIFVILFFVIISIKKRIHIAAELIKEVSKAIVMIPASLFWPFIPFILEVRAIFYLNLKLENVVKLLFNIRLELLCIVFQQLCILHLLVFGYSK